MVGALVLHIAWRPFQHEVRELPWPQDVLHFFGTVAIAWGAVTAIVGACGMVAPAVERLKD